MRQLILVSIRVAELSRNSRWVTYFSSNSCSWKHWVSYLRLNSCSLSVFIIRFFGPVLTFMFPFSRCHRSTMAFRLASFTPTRHRSSSQPKETLAAKHFLNRVSRDRAKSRLRRAAAKSKFWFMLQNSTHYLCKSSIWKQFFLTSSVTVTVSLL